jgi:hypothetical protein
MKPQFLLVLSLLLVQCHDVQKTDKQKPSIKPVIYLKKSSQQLAAELAMDTAKPAIQCAWYEYDAEVKALPTTARTGFTVLADTSFKAADFISTEERFLRHFSTASDTTISSYRADWVAPWKRLTKQQRRARIAREQASYARKADSLHTLNNRGRFRVWLLNNSADTIALNTEGESLVCVLQAQNMAKKWQPVQFWRFSSCGNSNIAKYLLPQESISFLASIPRKGNFKTALRYKIAGIKQFYYSNEFEGRIDYGEFKDYPQFFLDGEGVMRRSTHHPFKLDSLPRIVYRQDWAFPFRRGGQTIKLLPH